MPFLETQVEMSPFSNKAHCRAMPVWIPGILNDRSIQISATVARFRGNVRSCRSGSMPLIVGERMDSDMLPVIEKSENAVYIRWCSPKRKAWL